MSGIGGKKPVGSVVVSGAGIGGIQASLDLAEMGYKVYLLEKSSSIGGNMASLDKTFPTNDCSMCILGPKISECARHPKITILPLSEIREITGEPGNFCVKVLKKPRFVRQEKCTACADCVEACPVEVDNEYEMGLSKRKAIYIPFPQSTPNCYAIDSAACTRCGKCAKACKARAIYLNEKEEEIEINAGAVIVSSGYRLFDPHLRKELGFGIYENVVTGRHIERMLSASGFSKGKVLRPSDKKYPEKVAFIQCVGSRDKNNGFPHCSSVCCMYAIKESILLKEKLGKVECSVFYTDLRTYGKGFERYYNRARDQYGISFRRGNISKIREVPSSKNLLLQYCLPDGSVSEEEFDMVVLSTGIESSADYPAELSNSSSKDSLWGFGDGIYLCGTAREPMDIPETVIEAGAASALAGALLSGADSILTDQKNYPPESGEIYNEPRVAVLICHCGSNIAGVIDVVKLETEVAKHPFVKVVERNVYLCSEDGQRRMKELIAENMINRIVVASCSPRTHEPLFQEVIREAGLNKYLLEMANIRDHCSWVHRENPEEATNKAMRLINMAVNKSMRLEPLNETSADVEKRCLVVGGGIAGMSAAIAMAEQGVDVVLIEREKELGGNSLKRKISSNVRNPADMVTALIDKLRNCRNIEVLTEAGIKEFSGSIGNFHSVIETQDGKEIALSHGAAVIAIGGRECRPKKYMLGEDERVLTQSDFEQVLLSNGLAHRKFKNIVMVQCVGSRSKDKPYCSRVCCTQAVENAIMAKSLMPETDIYVLYRDMRTYGKKEELYTRARELGVRFMRFEEENEPQVRAEEKLHIDIFDTTFMADVSLTADLLVLSTGIEGSEGCKELSRVFKIPVNEDSFLLEAHAKLKPVDTSVDGVFICGLAHAPKSSTESMLQGLACASRAMTILSKEKVIRGGVISFIDENICIGCLKCLKTCPYEAVYFDDRMKVCRVDENKCKGCGTCAACCPSGANLLKNFKLSQIMRQIEGAFEI
ncbi:MAG: CoB--CoM heterodisulfide reductase iron-sulfur subunit A family protein [Candidatus Schekmanbacteria bacterium]|nr:CoB--CoM heterodisulfide reductase iron-sulfur subunit A family protein [Candidatus Schekmanbacteria bacterium]